MWNGLSSVPRLSGRASGFRPRGVVEGAREGEWLLFLPGLPSRAVALAKEESTWSARSGARTNDVDADEQRSMMTAARNTWLGCGCRVVLSGVHDAPAVMDRLETAILRYAGWLPASLHSPEDAPD
jgi:hypothetical protein